MFFIAMDPTRKMEPTFLMKTGIDHPIFNEISYIVSTQAACLNKRLLPLDRVMWGADQTASVESRSFFTLPSNFCRRRMSKPGRKSESGR
jgi:hypothetical protein